MKFKIKIAKVIFSESLNEKRIFFISQNGMLIFPNFSDTKTEVEIRDS